MFSPKEQTKIKSFLKEYGIMSIVFMKISSVFVYRYSI